MSESFKPQENVDELTSTIEREFKEIRNKRGNYEEQWYTNLAFMNGLQWVQWYTDMRTLVPSYSPTQRVRHVSNLIAPAVGIIKANLLGSEPCWHAHPSKKDNQSIESAEISNRLLQFVWEKSKALELLHRAYDGAIIKGDCYWKMFWNRNKGDRIDYFEHQIEPNDHPYIDEKNEQHTDHKGNPLYHKLDEGGHHIPAHLHLGGIEIALCEVDSVYVDPLALSDRDARYYYHSYLMPVQQIEDIYGVHVEAEKDLIGSGFEAQMDSLTGQSRDFKYKGSARIVEKWEKPSEKFPFGRVIIISLGCKTLLQYCQMPPEYLRLESQSPFIRFKMKSSPNAYYSRTQVTDARPVQKAINRILSRVQEHIDLLAAGKWMVANQMKLPKNYINAETAQVIRYQWGPWGEPKQANLAPIPAYVLELLEELRKDFNDIMGIHESSHGRTARGGVKSGAGLAALQESDRTQLESIVDGMKASLAQAGKMVLSIFKENGDIPMAISIVGKDKNYFLDNFLGSRDIDLDTEVTCEQDTSLPMNKVYREEIIKELYRERIIDRREARKALEIEDDDVQTKERADESKALWENDMMEAGEIVPVGGTDNHLDHEKIHGNRMNEPAFQALPAKVKQNYQIHFMSHEEHYSKGIMPTYVKLKVMEQTGPMAPPMPKKGSKVLTSATTMPKQV